MGGCIVGWVGGCGCVRERDYVSACVCVCAQSSSLSSSLKKIFITTIINIIIIQIPTLFFRALSNQHHSGSQRQAALQNNTISLVITVTSRRLLPWYYTLHFLLNEKWMGKLNEPGRQKLEELKSRQQTKRTKLYAILRAKRQHMTRPRKVARADELSLSPNGRGGGARCVEGGGEPSTSRSGTTTITTAIFSYWLETGFA